jgi:DDE family transposase
MLPTEDLFVYVYVLVDDAISSGAVAIASRPGPAPACTDAAHAEWFYGFRLAIKADLGSRVVRAWGIVPAAVNEREVASDLLAAGPPPRDLLCDKGFSGRAFAAAQAARGTAVLVPPAKDQRASMPAILLKVIAQWRNRIETSFAEITEQMELARHGAHTFWGLLTRTAATIAAHTLMRVCFTAT